MRRLAVLTAAAALLAACDDPLPKTLGKCQLEALNMNPALSYNDAPVIRVIHACMRAAGYEFDWGAGAGCAMPNAAARIECYKPTGWRAMLSSAKSAK